MNFRVVALLAALTTVSAVGASVGRDDLSDEDRARVAKVTAPTSDFSKSEPFESLQAGAGTTRKLVNADIFSQPSANLTFEGRQQFLVGNGLFRKDWVSAPSSTQASDGLGPLFNARSCQGCHTKDGRGSVPGFDPMERSDTVALLLRLSVPPSTDLEREKLASGHWPFVPEPVYGVQLQNFSVAGLPAEGRLEIDYEPITVALNGGETATLMKPTYRIENLGYGPMREDVQISPRLAQPMIGLGLLEAIHPDDILANAAKDHGDGIRGRPNWTRDARTGERVLGRFNWKASQPSVEQQSAAAFSNDMGLSTPLFPSHYGDCTKAQDECLKMPHGAQPHLGEHEVPGELLDFVTTYALNLAVPQRRDVDDARVLAGKKLFYEANCVACHVPKYVTRRDAARPEHRFQLIWPYTDMLLHDMGEGLADKVSEDGASGSEWRTPPLWGIGLTRTVNPHATWLHDGRARTLLEAILWHGGQAQAARDRVVAMTPEQRADLIRFLESL
ncbi:di-heme oxidoredictase family protein [Bordetella sp. 15P40C-2]|uniref:di-heme oxidoreductase family protein n=1 Tax=Bordetella sp. 15P40C-2 TaxID=2572246 RepID=UPI0013281068|nr:c-type cytochrome [Bordetella sp. 15P40C-2]